MDGVHKNGPAILFNKLEDPKKKEQLVTIPSFQPASTFDLKLLDMKPSLIAGPAMVVKVEDKQVAIDLAQREGETFAYTGGGQYPAQQQEDFILSGD